ncbi:MAG: protein kinase [Alphaproteobacteria bacterium]
MAATQRNALDIGTELDGYRVASILGAGGFGITYEAIEISIERKVAIKEFMPNGIAMRDGDSSVHPISDADEKEYVWGLDRFKQEARTLIHFRHPNIVPVLRYFEANGTAYMVMEHQEGKSLGRFMDGSKTLDAAGIAQFLMPLLDGLEQVHKSGFLHRDIKPDNIYIRTDGTPVLLDFGAARNALGRRSKSLTAVVSAGYAPYEQYEAEGNQGPWTDIYALGAVLYRCTVGRRPIDAPARVSATLRQDDDPLIPAAQAARGNYDAALLAGIDAALAISERDRPQTVAAFRRAIAPDGDAAAIGQRMAAPGATVKAGATTHVLPPATGPAPRTAPAAERAPSAAAVHISAAPAAVAPRRGKWPWIAAGAVLALLLIGGGAYLATRPADDADARLKLELEQARKAQAQLQADLDAARKADADAKAKAEQDAKAKQEADARAQAEARQQAEARRRADELARQRAAEEARRRAEEAARLKAEADARAQAEAKAQADAEAKRRADEAARLQTDAQRRADEAVRQRAEIEAKRRADEAVRQRAEADAKRRADAEAKRRADEAARGRANQRADAQATAPAVDYRSQIAGTSMYLDAVDLVNGSNSVLVRFIADGRVVVAAQRSQMGAAGGYTTDTSYSGTWSVQGDQLCLRFTNLPQIGNCYRVAVAGQRVTLAGPGFLARGALSK